jgi:hypothetical protein
MRPEFYALLQALSSPKNQETATPSKASHSGEKRKCVHALDYDDCLATAVIFDSNTHTFSVDENNPLIISILNDMALGKEVEIISFSNRQTEERDRVNADRKKNGLAADAFPFLENWLNERQVAGMPKVTYNPWRLLNSESGCSNKMGLWMQIAHHYANSNTVIKFYDDLGPLTREVFDSLIEGTALANLSEEFKKSYLKCINEKNNILSMAQALVAEYPHIIPEGVEISFHAFCRIKMDVLTYIQETFERNKELPEAEFNQNSTILSGETAEFSKAQRVQLGVHHAGQGIAIPNKTLSDKFAVLSNTLNRGDTKELGMLEGTSFATEDLNVIASHVGSIQDQQIGAKFVKQMSDGYKSGMGRNIRNEHKKDFIDKARNEHTKRVANFNKLKNLTSQLQEMTGIQLSEENKTAYEKSLESLETKLKRLIFSIESEHIGDICRRLFKTKKLARDAKTCFEEGYNAAKTASSASTASTSGGAATNVATAKAHLHAVGEEPQKRKLVFALDYDNCLATALHFDPRSRENPFTFNPNHLLIRELKNAMARCKEENLEFEVISFSNRQSDRLDHAAADDSKNGLSTEALKALVSYLNTDKKAGEPDVHYNTFRVGSLESCWVNKTGLLTQIAHHYAPGTMIHFYDDLGPLALEDFEKLATGTPFADARSKVLAVEYLKYINNYDLLSNANQFVKDHPQIIPEGTHVTFNHFLSMKTEKIQELVEQCSEPQATKDAIQKYIGDVKSDQAALPMVIRPFDPILGTGKAMSSAALNILFEDLAQQRSDSDTMFVYSSSLKLGKSLKKILDPMFFMPAAEEQSKLLTHLNKMHEFVLQINDQFKDIPKCLSSEDIYICFFKQSQSKLDELKVAIHTKDVAKTQKKLMESSELVQVTESFFRRVYDVTVGTSVKQAASQSGSSLFPRVASTPSPAAYYTPVKIGGARAVMPGSQNSGGGGGGSKP